MDFLKHGLGTADFLMEIQQTMMSFHGQLNELRVKVVQLEERLNQYKSSSPPSNPGASDNNKKLANTHQTQTTLATSSQSFPPAGGVGLSELAGKEIVRLDGRIDLLNGKINLVKHELSKVLSIGSQSRQPRQFNHGNGNWDEQMPSFPGGGGDDSYSNQGQVIVPEIKAEPEVLLNEYEDERGDDGFLYPNSNNMTVDDGGDNISDDDGDDQDDPDYKHQPDKNCDNNKISRNLRKRRKFKLESDDDDDDDEVDDYSTMDPLQSIARNTNGKFKCPSCSIEYNTKKELSTHYNTKHNKKQVSSYNCNLCVAKFTDKKNWTLHLKVNHLGNVDQNTDIKNLLGAIERNPSTNKFPCPYQSCGKEFCYKRDIVRHYVTHSGHLPFSCNYCPISFARSDRLAAHKLSKHRETMIKDESSRPRTILRKGAKQCPICFKSFTRPGHTLRHFKTHDINRTITTIRQFKCVACAKSYSRRDKLRAHQREKHGKVFEGDEHYVVELDKEQGEGDEGSNKDKKLEVFHECTECKKSFNQKSKLTRHMIGCQGLKPFNCKECGKNFTQKSALIQHGAAIHQGVKRFLCSDCGSCFYGSTNYKKHVRSHTGVKPYPCSVCGRHFNGRSDLKRHKRIHTGIRNYACTQCDLKFCRRDALAKHQLVHTGEKPWMCDLCGSSFSQSGSMKKHRDACSLKTVEGRKISPYRKPRMASKLGLGSSQDSISVSSICSSGGASEDVGGDIPDLAMINRQHQLQLLTQYTTLQQQQQTNKMIMINEPNVIHNITSNSNTANVANVPSTSTSSSTSGSNPSFNPPPTIFEHKFGGF